MRGGVARAAASVVAVCAANWVVPASAGDLTTCATAQESRAFSLRHLQSRLMVAALACNQRDAYNNFVEAFRPPLASAGLELVGYFQRSGGGQSALNRHITELANVAGLYRAENPEAYCQETWTMFLSLQDDPAALDGQASSHVLKDAGTPALCAPAPADELVAEAAEIVKTAETPGVD